MSNVKIWLGILLRLSIIATIGTLLAVAPDAAQKEFDQNYSSYSDLLNAHVRGSRIDYTSLIKNRPLLDSVAEEFSLVSKEELESWPPKQQLAYWINAYNLFTLHAIVDHYPIKGNWFSWHPRNSIRQIDGVWDELLWPAGGQKVTLDQIVLRSAVHHLPLTPTQPFILTYNLTLQHGTICLPHTDSKSTILHSL